MTREQKDEIDRLVDIFILDLDSLTHSAGWHQDSILSKMITYRGDLPQPSGYDQSDLTMLHEMRFLKKPHALLPMIKAIVSAMERRDVQQARALLASRFYQGCYVDPETNTVKTFKDTTRSSLVGMAPKQYRRKLDEAYASFADIAEIIQAGARLAG